MDRVTLIGEPELNRTQGFACALEAVGVEFEILPYVTILREGDGWKRKLEQRWIRIESPGRSLAVERAILVRGARVGVESDFSTYANAVLTDVQLDLRRIFATRQWYLGFTDILAEIAAVAAKGSSHFLNPPRDIATLFDKPACWNSLHSAGIPVPRALAVPANFDELRSSLKLAGWSRAFLKPSHGSGGGGVVAIAFSGDRVHATTAVEMAEVGGELFLYSTRRLHVYRDPANVRRLVEALCRERLHVEEWVPKAGLAGRTFDVRVVVIRGRACHLAVRLGRGPLTNLHLAAEKQNEQFLVERTGLKTVALVRETAEKAAACFPQLLYAGIDIAVTPGFRRAVVLEINAFGDRLEGIDWLGADTYTWEVRAMLDQHWPPSV